MNSTPKKSLNYIDIKKYNNKCASVICTCNKHHCPVKSEIPHPTHYLTTSKLSYRPQQITPRKQLTQSVYHQRQYDPNILNTSYNRDYSPKKQKTPIKKEIPLDQEQSSFRFPVDSEYKEQFIKQQQFKQQGYSQAKPYHYIPGFAYKDSIYKQEFTSHKIPKQDFIMANQFHTPLKQQNMICDNSTYKDHFQRHVIQRQQNQINRSLSPHYQAPLQNIQSAYKEHYPTYGKQLYEKPKCPIDLLPKFNGVIQDKQQQQSYGKIHLKYSIDKNQWE